MYLWQVSQWKLQIMIVENYLEIYQSKFISCNSDVRVPFHFRLLPIYHFCFRFIIEVSEKSSTEVNNLKRGLEKSDEVQQPSKKNRGSYVTPLCELGYLIGLIYSANCYKLIY